MPKFYGFTSSEAVNKHISQVKSWSDLLHLASDIKRSKTNLVEFHVSVIPGISEVRYYAMPDPERHLFFTKSAWENTTGRLRTNLRSVAASINILED
ncbi:hypothetical protein FD723_40240 (plasmid) [Nostoc sp. C052]|uniref:hypothetical protein n=1 Tax=Nostoc sp. C052 TaxID=2576902 RepID=UPI0015C33F51|nr:hypothetical protein [Nostoc sp. C052]QLE46444.1 hypothetical protein FD723_40240 [Nostoc sp. C052]